MTETPTPTPDAAPEGLTLDVMAVRIRDAVEGEMEGLALGYAGSHEIVAYALTGFPAGPARDAALADIRARLAGAAPAGEGVDARIAGLDFAADIADHWHQRFLLLRQEADGVVRQRNLTERAEGAKQVLDAIRAERARLAATPSPARSDRPEAEGRGTPVAWRCRSSEWPEDRAWDYPTERPDADYGYNIVEPLYAAAPTHAREDDEAEPAFSNGVTHAIEILARAVGCLDWQIRDGSDDRDDDIAATIMGVLVGGELYNDDTGEWARLAAAPTPASSRLVDVYQAAKEYVDNHEHGSLLKRIDCYDALRIAVVNASFYGQQNDAPTAPLELASAAQAYVAAIDAYRRGEDGLTENRMTVLVKAEADLRVALAAAPTPPAGEGVDIEDIAIRAFVAQRADKEVDWVKDYHVSDFRAHDRSFTPLSAAVSAALAARLTTPATGTDDALRNNVALARSDLAQARLNVNDSIASDKWICRADDKLRTALGASGVEG